MSRIPASLLVCSLIPILSGTGLIVLSSEPDRHQMFVEQDADEVIVNPIPPIASTKQDRVDIAVAVADTKPDLGNLQSGRPPSAVASAEDDAVALFKLPAPDDLLLSSEDAPIPPQRPEGPYKLKHVSKMFISNKASKALRPLARKDDFSIASAGTGSQGKNSGAYEFALKEGSSISLFALPHN